MFFYFAEFLLFFSLCLVCTLLNIYTSRIPCLSAQKKTTTNKKAEWASPDAHLTFCFVLSMYVCMFARLYVLWCSWSMSTHGYICEHRECNVIVSFVFFLSPSVFSFTLNLFHWLLTALSVFFSVSLSHTLSLISVMFLLSLFICPSFLVFPVLFSLFGSSLPSSPRPGVGAGN